MSKFILVSLLLAGSVISRVGKAEFVGFATGGYYQAAPMGFAPAGFAPMGLMAAPTVSFAPAGYALMPTASYAPSAFVLPAAPPAATFVVNPAPAPLLFAVPAAQPQPQPLTFYVPAAQPQPQPPPVTLTFTIPAPTPTPNPLPRVPVAPYYPPVANNNSAPAARPAPREPVAPTPPPKPAGLTSSLGEFATQMFEGKITHWINISHLNDASVSAVFSFSPALNRHFRILFEHGLSTITRVNVEDIDGVLGTGLWQPKTKSWRSSTGAAVSKLTFEFTPVQMDSNFDSAKGIYATPLTIRFIPLPDYVPEIREKTPQEIRNEKLDREVAENFRTYPENRTGSEATLPLTETVMNVASYQRLARLELEGLVQAVQSPPYSLKVVVVASPVEPAVKGAEVHNVTNAEEDAALAAQLANLAPFKSPAVDSVYFPAGPSNFNDGADAIFTSPAPLLAIKKSVAPQSILRGLVLHLALKHEKSLKLWNFFERGFRPGERVTEAQAFVTIRQARQAKLAGKNLTDEDLRREVQALRSLLDVAKYQLAALDANWFLFHYGEVLGLGIDLETERQNAQATLASLTQWASSMTEANPTATFKDDFPNLAEYTRVEFLALAKDISQVLDYRFRAGRKLFEDLR